MVAFFNILTLRDWELGKYHVLLEPLMRGGVGGGKFLSIKSFLAGSRSLLRRVNNARNTNANDILGYHSFYNDKNLSP